MRFFPRLIPAVAACLAITASSAASALVITGNPLADGWTLTGNSVTAGTYVRGHGGYNFDVYSQSFSIDAGSPLIFSGNWQIGDTVLGLGGVYQGTSPDVTFRSVAKFGGATSSYSAATSFPPGTCNGVAGCGTGSSSGGAGGEGNLLVGFNYTRTDGDLNNAAWHNTAILPETLRYYDGTELNYDANATARDYARIWSVFNGTGDSSTNDTIDTWEVFLNISAMARDAVFNDLPAIGALSILTFQRSTSSTEFTDALTTISAVPPAVTAPHGIAFLGLGLAGLVALRRRTGPPVPACQTA